MRSLQLQAASSAVAEVLQASREQAELRRLHVSQGRAAMLIGDAEALAVAAVESSLSHLRQTQLEEIRQARELLRQHSQTVHQASRLQLQQMETVVEQSSTQERLEEQRRGQTTSDDLYGARLAWKKGAGSQPPPGDRPSMKRA